MHDVLFIRDLAFFLKVLIYLSDLRVLCILWEGSHSQKPAKAKCPSFYLSEAFISDLL